MDDNDRDLVNRLVAMATAMLEDAIEVAIRGQSARLTPSHLADVGHRLRADSRDIAVIAECALIVARLDINKHRNPANLPC